MINLTVKEFSDINLYNNKNVEQVMSKIIAESANGVLVSVFDDNIILYDNHEKDFYSAEYKFTKDEFIMENFEKIKLKRDKTAFDEAVKDFFSGEADEEDLSEAYENIFSETEKLLSESINERLLTKTSKFDFFNSILEAKKSLDLEKFHSTELYENYMKRYQERPSQHVYYFDWSNPTCVSLYENESKEIYVRTSKDKALNVWKESSFREQLKEAVSTLVKDVKAGQEELITIVENNVDLVTLSEIEFKEVVSKSILMEDIEDSEDVIEGIMELYKNFDLGKKFEEINETYTIIEQDEVPGQAAPAQGDNIGAEADDMGDEAPEPTTEELDVTIESLEELKDSVEDEKAKSFLEGVIAKLNDMKEEGKTDPELLKEIARLLAPSEEPEEEEVPAEGGEEMAPEEEPEV
jgi:hypothetical protein